MHATESYKQNQNLNFILRATEKSLFLFQTMAILEIIHPIVGLVKTSVITTMFQGKVFDSFLRI